MAIPAQLQRGADAICSGDSKCRRQAPWISDAMGANSVLRPRSAAQVQYDQRPRRDCANGGELSRTVVARTTVPAGRDRLLRVAGAGRWKDQDSYITANDQPIFGFAALWDTSKTDTGERIESVAHITLPANNLVGDIHNTKLRMPAILEKADRDAWLNGTPEEAWETLTPYPDDLMVAWPVSTRVNTPKNNDAKLDSARSVDEASRDRLLVWDNARFFSLGDSRAREPFLPHGVVCDFGERHDPYATGIGA